MVPPLLISDEDGCKIPCVRISPTVFMSDADVRHIALILLDRKRRGCPGDGGLPLLFSSHVFDYLQIVVGRCNLWGAFGINSDGLPERGQGVHPEQALALLQRVPEGRLLGVNWTFPGADGGYSLLHRACDPTLEEFEENVAIALLKRADFAECNAKRYGVTALHFMAARGWPKACTQLIQRTDFVETLSWVQASIESSNGVFFHPGDTVLDVARSTNNLDVVQAVRQTLAKKNKEILARHEVTHF